MSTQWNRRASELDPENSLLWRMPRRRMEAEELRDSILAAGGLLDSTMHGTNLVTSPFQDLSAGGLSRSPSLYQSSRRSVYLPVLRGALFEVYRTFDFPDPAVSSGDRAATTIASQALFMMNSAIVAQSAENLARMLLNDNRLSDRNRLGRACQCILGRPATALDLADWSAFLERYESTALSNGEDRAARRRSAWQGLCRALFSSNEFVYVE